MPRKNKHPEERSRAKELQELRRDNRKLKQQVLRLQKQLVRLQNHTSAEETSASPAEASPKPTSALCRICQHPLKTIDLPSGGKLIGCAKCRFRERLAI